ncbi:MAG: hypothetical protein Kow00128_23600 [Deltaproteobacteria bacterium]
MRQVRSVPVRAILLFLAVVGLLRAATAYPHRTILLQPDLLGAALFLYTPLLHYRGGRKPSWIAPGGLRTGLLLFAGAGAAGAVLFALAVRIPGFLPPPAPASSLPPPGEFLFRQALLVALPEEVFFRGFLYDAFEETGWEPILSSSLFFAAGHLAILFSPYRALTLFPALLFGWTRKRTGAIHVPVLLHLFFNLLPYLHASL